MNFLNRVFSIFRWGSSAAVLPDPSPNVIQLYGSYVAIQSFTGSVLPAVLQGSYVPIQSLEGSV